MRHFSGRTGQRQEQQQHCYVNVLPSVIPEQHGYVMHNMFVLSLLAAALSMYAVVGGGTTRKARTAA